MNKLWQRQNVAFQMVLAAPDNSQMQDAAERAYHETLRAPVAYDCDPDCPALHVKSGCGFKAAGTPCRHPRYRRE